MDVMTMTRCSLVLISAAVCGVGCARNSEAPEVVALKFLNALSVGHSGEARHYCTEAVASQIDRAMSFSPTAFVGLKWRYTSVHIAITKEYMDAFVSVELEKTSGDKNLHLSPITLRQSDARNWKVLSLGEDGAKTLSENMSSPYEGHYAYGPNVFNVDFVFKGKISEKLAASLQEIEKQGKKAKFATEYNGDWWFDWNKEIAMKLNDASAIEKNDFQKQRRWMSFDSANVYLGEYKENPTILRLRIGGTNALLKRINDKEYAMRVLGVESRDAGKILDRVRTRGHVVISCKGTRLYDNKHKEIHVYPVDKGSFGRWWNLSAYDYVSKRDSQIINKGKMLKLMPIGENHIHVDVVVDGNSHLFSAEYDYGSTLSIFGEHSASDIEGLRISYGSTLQEEEANRILMFAKCPALQDGYEFVSGHVEPTVSK